MDALEQHLHHLDELLLRGVINEEEHADARKASLSQPAGQPLGTPWGSSPPPLPLYVAPSSASSLRSAAPWKGADYLVLWLGIVLLGVGLAAAAASVLQDLYYLSTISGPLPSAAYLSLATGATYALVPLAALWIFLDSHRFNAEGRQQSPAAWWLSTVLLAILAVPWWAVVRSRLTRTQIPAEVAGVGLVGAFTFMAGLAALVGWASWAWIQLSVMSA